MIITTSVVGYLAVGFLLSRYVARWTWNMRKPDTSGAEIDANAMGMLSVPFWPLTLLVVGVRAWWRRNHHGLWNPNQWIMKDVDR